MATAGTYVEANGLRVYYVAYGEDEGLGQPGVSKEPGRSNSTVYGLGEREIGHVHRRSVADLSFSEQVREEPIREGKTILHHMVPDSPTALSHPCGTRRISRASWSSSASPTTSPPTTQTMVVHNVVKEMNKPTKEDGS
jgi:hypothetical protein